MPFQLGQPKPSTSGRPPGRPKGSLSRRTQIARDLVERLNFDPLEFLLKTARNKRVPLDLRLDAAKTAVKFCHPQLSTAAVLARTDVNVEMTTKIKAIMHADADLADQMEAIALRLALADDPAVIDIRLIDPEDKR